MLMTNLDRNIDVLPTLDGVHGPTYPSTNAGDILRYR